MPKIVAFIFFCICNLPFCFSQIELIDAPLRTSSNNREATIAEHLARIESDNGMVFSYSTNQFDENELITLPEKNLTVREALNYVFTNYNLYITRLSSRKYQLITSKKNKFSLSGLVLDQESGEPIPGAIIINNSTQEYVLSDEKGFFFINLPIGDMNISTKFLGYKEEHITQTLTGSLRKNIYLKFQNSISPIIVSEKAFDHHLLDPGSDLISAKTMGTNSTVFGDQDVMANIKTNPGVSSGGEGQSGLYVRGSNSYQNLILLDGIPLYETSHIAGISSIFIDESIRSVDFIKSGIPAKYSGRLSSVINLQVKDGNNTQSRQSISAGIMGVKFHAEGPIGKDKKLSYLIAARTSWINLLLDAIVPKLSLYDDINIAMNDLTTKITYRFDNEKKLTLTSYVGNDNLQLYKNGSITQSPDFNSEETNSLKWSNALVTMNYDQILTKKTKLHLNIGLLRYQNKSRSIFDFGTPAKKTFVDVISFSEIKDLQFKAEYDYYVSDNVKWKIGCNVIGHKFSPTVKQSIIKINDVENLLIDPDSIIRSTENFVFSEMQIHFTENFIAYPGLNYSIYHAKSASYNNLQPRLRMAFVPNLNTVISASFTRSIQNIHLLSNPGIGLPSDLWVSSNENIAPEQITHFSLDYNQSIGKGWELNISGYKKSATNIIEFDIPTDLFVNIINNNGIVPVFTRQNDWQTHVKSGKSEGSGIELMVRKNIGMLKGWTSFTYNRTTHYFDDIDEGKGFPAKYSRPLDVNIGLNYEPNDKWNFGLNWVYTSGNYFTFPNEAFQSVFNIEQLRPDGRNNYQLPAFHQLSINADKKLIIRNIKSKIGFGIYNVYNHLNAYFVYAIRDPDISSPIFRKVSIFPILPHINFTMEW